MQNETRKEIPATLIPGDGIGPEIVEATLKVLDALGAPFGWEVQRAGMAGVAACGDQLPAATRESIRRTRLALNGPLTTPVGGGYRSSNVRLRKEFDLYANVRPARTMIPGGGFGHRSGAGARERGSTSASRITSPSMATRMARRSPLA